MNLSVSFNSLFDPNLREFFYQKNAQPENFLRTERINSQESQVTWDYDSLKKMHKLKSYEFHTSSDLVTIDETYLDDKTKFLHPEINNFQLDPNMTSNCFKKNSKSILSDEIFQNFVPKSEKTNVERLNEAARRCSYIF